MTLRDAKGEIVPVRWSWASQADVSLAHARHQALHGRDASVAMKFGTAGHAAAFEPHRLVIYRGGDMTVTDAKGKVKVKTYTDVKQGAMWDAFKAAQPADAVIVNAKEHAKVTAIAESLRRADAARVDRKTGEPLPLLFGPDVLRERRIVWTRNGRLCASIPDARNPGRWIADLKLVRSAKPERFVRSATWMGYPGQLSFYAQADAADLRLAMPTADRYIVAVEPFAPYVVVTYKLTPRAVEFGDRQVDRCWDMITSAEAVDHWPGYVDAIADFDSDEPEDEFGIIPADDPDLGADDAENDNAGEPGIDWSAA